MYLRRHPITPQYIPIEHDDIIGFPRLHPARTPSKIRLFYHQMQANMSDFAAISPNRYILQSACRKHPNNFLNR